MEFDLRRLESWLLVILAGACGILLYQRCAPSEVTNHDAAYRLQEAYYKMWINDPRRFATVSGLKDLVPILNGAGFDLPKAVDRVVLAPNTSVSKGTALFLALPKQNQYSMPIPPSIQMLSPTNKQDYALGDTIKLLARVTDQQCQIIKVEVRINDEEAGTLPSVGDQVSGAWKPTKEGNNTVTMIAYNEFGLTASATASNITVHENHPPTVLLPQLSDEMTFAAGTAYKLWVSALDPDKPDTVTDVSLMVNGKPLSTLTQEPYEFVFGPLEPGIYMVHATAHDQHGSKGESYIYKVYVK